MEEQIEQQNNTAKFAFFYLLSLVSLIFMTTAVGMIIFQIINKLVADLIHTEQFSSGTLKFAISAIIISTPIYYLTAWQINKNLVAGVLRLESGVRKWLTYFILLIASVVMIGWLIGSINSFLNGDLTAKFILKAITSIALAGAVFGYYFYDIKREKVVGAKDKIVMIYFYATLAIVVISLVASFFFVESPTTARNRIRDDQVLAKFDMIDAAINTYYTDNNKFPASLDLLITEKRLQSENDIKDPVTGQKFDYKPGKDKIYELCATFLSSNQQPDFGNYYQSRWLHNAGYQCLSQRNYTVSPGKPGQIVPVVPVK